MDTTPEADRESGRGRLAWLRRRLGYANVMATAAVFLALGGGAYAITLPKKSVRSKHIKNGQVKSPDLGRNAVHGGKVADNSLTGADIADNSLTGGDIADNSLTGGDIVESSLGTVPAAESIGGFTSGDLGRTYSIARQDFDPTSSLALAVPGFGTVRLICDDNGTPGTANDDLVGWGFSFNLGGPFTRNGFLAVAPSLTSDPSATRVLASTDAGATSGTSTTMDDVLYLSLALARVDGSRSATITGGAEEDPSSDECAGQLQAVVTT